MKFGNNKLKFKIRVGGPNHDGLLRFPKKYGLKNVISSRHPPFPNTNFGSVSITRCELQKIMALTALSNYLIRMFMKTCCQLLLLALQHKI